MSAHSKHVKLRVGETFTRKRMNPRANTIERLLQKVEQITESGCWIYTGRLTRDGYASVFYQGRMAPLHRIFYEHFIDKIPQGLEPDHLCRVRCCENPWHLEIVSRLENTMRGNSVPAINARKTHCKYGHPFSGRNLHIRSDGSRSCRMCLANKERRKIIRRRERRGQ